MTPGIYDNISNSDYRAWPGLSQSMMQSLRRSPAHLRYELDHPEPETDSTVLGSALHTLLLEPREYDARFAVGGPVNPKTLKAYGRDTKAFAEWAAQQTKQIVTAEQAEALKAMVDAVHACEYARYILKLADRRELSIAWEDRATGVACKGRVDGVWLDEELPVAFDIKTTRDASREAFARAIVNYGYDIQASHYMAGLAALGVHVESFAFICVENAPPYATAVYRLTETTLSSGYAKRKPLLAKYAECVASNEWPGYPAGIQEIEAPRWGLVDSEELEEQEA